MDLRIATEVIPVATAEPAEVRITIDFAVRASLLSTTEVVPALWSPVVIVVKDPVELQVKANVGLGAVSPTLTCAVPDGSVSRNALAQAHGNCQCRLLKGYENAEVRDILY